MYVCPRQIGERERSGYNVQNFPNLMENINIYIQKINKLQVR